MEKTSDFRTDILKSRVLDYQPVSTDEKISTFQKRIQEQIDCIRLGEKNETLNDSQKAENYAKKCERFLASPFFTDKQYRGKNVSILKRDLKVHVGMCKEIITILEQWIEKRRGMKLTFANMATPVDENATEKKKQFLLRERVRLYTATVSFFQEKYSVISDELGILQTLLDMLLNKELMEFIGAKRSWKVSKLKEELLSIFNGKNPADDESKAKGISRESLKALLVLKYFRHKKYLNMEVRELLDNIGVDASILKHVLEWISERLEANKSGLKDAKKETHSEGLRVEISRILSRYDEENYILNSLKRDIEKTYSLYRFGQGLLENDIFESLYV